MNDELQEAKEQLATVSKAFHEYVKHEDEKKIHTLKFVIIILSILLFVSVCANVAFAIYENSMETVTETTETVTTTFEDIEQNADGGGTKNIVGGDFINGTPNN